MSQWYRPQKEQKARQRWRRHSEAVKMSQWQPIVERLRQPVMLHSDAEQTNAERAEAADEIERLHGSVAIVNNLLAIEHAENERLRAALEEASTVLWAHIDTTAPDDDPDMQVVRKIDAILDPPASGGQP